METSRTSIRQGKDLKKNRTLIEVKLAELENTSELHTDMPKLEAQRLDSKFNKLDVKDVLFRADTSLILMRFIAV